MDLTASFCLGLAVFAFVGRRRCRAQVCDRQGLDSVARKRMKFTQAGAELFA